MTTGRINQVTSSGRPATPQRSGAAAKGRQDGALWWGSKAEAGGARRGQHLAGARGRHSTPFNCLCWDILVGQPTAGTHARGSQAQTSAETTGTAPRRGGLESPRHSQKNARALRVPLEKLRRGLTSGHPTTDSSRACGAPKATRGAPGRRARRRTLAPFAPSTGRHFRLAVSRLNCGS